MPDTPINVSPADMAVDVSLTPTLLSSAFSSSTTVLVPGGLPDPDWKVGLMVSQDGIRYSQEVYRPLAEYGRYADRLQWRGKGGLGSYESFMGIRLRSNAPIEFSTDALWVDVLGL